MTKYYANNILNISEMMRYHWKHLDALDCTAFSCHKEETEQSCSARQSSSTSVTLGFPPIVTRCEKEFEGEGAVWYPVWVYMYLKVGMSHFYRLVLGLMNILLKSKLFRWWMSYGDMTDYRHATIIRVLLSKII